MNKEKKEKLITKIAKKLKGNLKPELSCINFTKDEVQVSNSYYGVIFFKDNILLEGLYKIENFINGFTSLDDGKLINKQGIVYDPIKSDLFYPDISKVYGEKTENYISFSVNNMIDLLEIAKEAGIGSIKFNIRERILFAEEKDIKFLISKNN